MVNEYWKARLNDDEKACYETILGGAKAVADSVQCLRTHVSSVEKAYFAVVEDHPELFYMSNQYNCKYYRTGKGANEYDDVTVFLEYVYSDAEINEYRVTVNNRIKEFRRMTVGMTTQQKVISSVEYLIDITKYEINYATNQNAAAALCKGAAQCSGISKAMKLLLNSVNVLCHTVTGEADGGAGTGFGPHEWCIVTMCGKHYHVDPTFMLGNNASRRPPYIKNWLFYDDETLSETHRWDRKKYHECKDPSLKIKYNPATNVPAFGNTFKDIFNRIGGIGTVKQMQSNARTDESQKTSCPEFTTLIGFRRYLEGLMKAREESGFCIIRLQETTPAKFQRYVKSSVEMVQRTLDFNTGVSLSIRADGAVGLQIKYDN